MYLWGASIHEELGVLCRPRGLEQFVPSKKNRVVIWPLTDGKLTDVLIGPVSSRPSCHLHADQCTIGSMTIFFCGSRIRCTGNPDCFHRLWNDVQDGWKCAWQWGIQLSNHRACIGQSSSAPQHDPTRACPFNSTPISKTSDVAGLTVTGNVSLLTACVQSHIGPFKSSDFQKQLQDACMEIRASVRPDHPIMASLPFVLRDLNIDETEEHTPEVLWKLAMNTKFGKKQTAAGVAFVFKGGTSQSTRFQAVKRNTTQYTHSHLVFLAAMRHAASSRTCRHAPHPGPTGKFNREVAHGRPPQSTPKLPPQSSPQLKAQCQPGVKAPGHGPALVPGRSSPPWGAPCPTTPSSPSPPFG